MNKEKNKKIETKKPDNDKQKKVNLTIEQRLKIIAELNAGQSVTNIAEQWDVSKTTISRIKKKKEDIQNVEKVLKECDGDIMKRRYKGTEESALEKSLYEWFVQRRCSGIPISGSILQEKAIQFNNLIGGSAKFKASSGWLDKFKKRHGIRCLAMHGEKLSADIEGSENFKVTFNNLISVTGISLDQIYNCDETGLYWRMLPERTLAGKSEQCVSGRKKPKARITIMVCTNASGTHKLPLFAIGHSQKPRCFKTVGTLPVIYRQQESAWMTVELMVDYLQSVFIPEVQKKHFLDINKDKKIILLMDNAKCHSTEERLNVLADFLTVQFLPPNVTSLIQPMDQGVIEKFKRCYKKAFVQSILSADSKEAADKALKAFNLWNCVNFAAASWDKITQSDIRNCWKSLIPLTSADEFLPDMCMIDTDVFHSIISKIPELGSITPQAIKNWLSADSAETGWEIFDDDQIVKQVMDSSTENYVPQLPSASNNQQTEEDTDEYFANVTTFEALEATNTLLNFYEKDVDTETYMPMIIEVSKNILEKLSVDSH